MQEHLGRAQGPRVLRPPAVYTGSGATGARPSRMMRARARSSSSAISGGGLRQFPDPPAAGDFAFTANGHESGAEVAEQVGDLGPWWWGATSFSATRMETLYVPATSTTLCH